MYYAVGTRAGAKIPGQNLFPKETKKKQEKDVLKQEKYVLKKEKMF